ncbi:hypothetical protein BHYA_0090g00230 [Botrytis hyacinthi]|uniref:SRR1-like domain-containing protein n=1 Tax=Botrytis hyacinthi TaxID=278943 RepID=A0A4Z1GWG1_9HELO|nr:hypothetical protein BHYA_0090g00230 [Botrytis hyacinthi]
MPHTNRKKKSGARDTGEEAEKTKKIAQSTKRKQIEDGEGWTHVVGGGKKTGAAETWTHAGDFVKDGVAYIERSMEEMQADLESYRKQWEGSEAAGQLKKILHGRGKVNSVVCLGLGSLQSARREGRRSSYTQLAALMMIIEEFGELCLESLVGDPKTNNILGGMGEDKMQCIFQDPQNTEGDKDFFTSLGGKVVDDPLAFDYIKEDTLVYAIHCYGPVYKTISQGPRPAVLIGTDVDNFSNLWLSKTETLEQHLDDMIKDCEIINFPQLRHDFSDTKIYWRNKPTV